MRIIYDSSLPMLTPLENKDLISERDINAYYHENFKKYIKDYSIKYGISPRTDGILEISLHEKIKNLKILFEFKKHEYESNLLVSCICQCLFYLIDMPKQLSSHELKKYPDILFIGFSNMFACIKVSDLSGYLLNEDVRIDLGNKGTDAFINSIQTKKKIKNDKNIYAHIFDKKRVKNIVDIFSKLFDKKTEIEIPINSDTTNSLFIEFETKVLLERITSEQKSALFISILCNPELNIINKDDQNLLKTSLTDIPEVKIDGNEYKDLLNKIKILTNKEKETLISRQDKIIEQKAKIGKGQFYTPLIICQDNQIQLNKVLTKYGWPGSFSVWDCSCGTGNLDRNIPEVKNLFCSTLLQSDIDLFIQNKINPNAVVFCFDYLTELGPDCIDKETFELKKEYITVFDTLKKGPFLYYNNYPFRDKDQNKSEVIENSFKDILITDGLGKECSTQLFSGFIYRHILSKERLKLDNLFLAFYCKLTLFQSSDFDSLRTRLFENFKFIHGDIFNSKEFGCNEEWPISFSIWECGKTSFPLKFSVKEIDKNTGNINLIDEIVIDKSPVLNINTWAKQDLKTAKEFRPLLKGCVKLSEKNECKTVQKGFLGAVQYHSNNVGSSRKFSALYTGIPDDGKIPIYETNIYKCTSSFACRRIIYKKIDMEKTLWYKETLEFDIPKNSLSEEFKIWQYNTLIYSIFEEQSHQSSLRNTGLKKCNNLTNEFFWIGREQIGNKLQEISFKVLENDFLQFSGERTIFRLINEIKNFLYPESENLLNYCTGIYIETLKRRINCYANTPKFFLDNSLQSWDCGWEQIRNTILEKNEVEGWKDLLRKLEIKLLPAIYKYDMFKEK